MNTNKSTLPEQLEGYEDTSKQIKEHLKKVVPEDVYEEWISRFEFEEISSKRIVVGYYGSKSIKKFRREHGKNVWVNICAVTGYSKKFIIRKRKSKPESSPAVNIRRHLKMARLFAISAVFAGVAAALAVVVCSYISNMNFKETFYNVSSIKVDTPIRIIQISDLHNCTYGKENSKLLDRVEKLNPDVIICTGDILDSRKDRRESVADMCAVLSEIAPSYYVYGNNEVEKLYDFPLNEKTLDKKFGFTKETRDPSRLTSLADSFEKSLEKTGIKVLKNETDTITVGTTSIDVFGVLTSNPSSFWTYAGGEFENYVYTNPDNLKITAIHEPFIFEDFKHDFWGDLMVCGHTHGGTVRVPVLGPLYTHEGGIFPEKDGDYVYGRYDVSGRPLIVSSGLENKSILRINNQPELVIIDINKF